jgi:hypothetical protein
MDQLRLLALKHKLLEIPENYELHLQQKPITRAARTPGSWVRIPLKAMMSVCIYSVFVALCVGSGLATGRSPVQGVLLTVYRIKKLKRQPMFNKGL